MGGARQADPSLRRGRSLRAVDAELRRLDHGGSQRAAGDGRERRGKVGLGSGCGREALGSSAVREAGGHPPRDPGPPGRPAQPGAPGHRGVRL